MSAAAIVSPGPTLPMHMSLTLAFRRYAPRYALASPIVLPVHFGAPALQHMSIALTCFLVRLLKGSFCHSLMLKPSSSAIFPYCLNPSSECLSFFIGSDLKDGSYSLPKLSLLSAPFDISAMLCM